MSLPRFPTIEADERLRAVGDSGVERVPLHGTPAPPLPPHVVEAVAATLSRGHAAPPPRGLTELREALARRLAATGRAVDPGSELVVTNGAMHALNLVFRALLEPGDEVVVPAPCFFFEGPITAARGVPVHVPCSAADGWAWSADAIERSLTPATRALLLCNPDNPTGRVHEPGEVAAAVAVAERHGLLIVTDEAYEALLWEGARLTSAFALTERALLVRSLGKSLSLPHLRLGLVAGPPPLVGAVAAALEWDVLRVGLAPQVAALAVLDGDDGWLRDVHAALAADRTAALAAVTEAGLEVVPPGGGPFLFCSDGSPLLADELLGRGIPLVDGVHFHAPGWARIPLGGAAAAAGALRTALARRASR